MVVFGCVGLCSGVADNAPEEGSYEEAMYFTDRVLAGHLAPT